MPLRVGAYAVDGKAREARRRGDFRGVEFDNPVIHFAHIDHRADWSPAFRDNFCSWPTAVASSESDERAGLVVADGGKRAMVAGDDDAGATTQKLTSGGSDTTCEAD